MNKIIFISLLTLCINIQLSFAQTVDLTSVDEFLKVASTLREGKEVSDDQWTSFECSSSYKSYANRENKFMINTIKSTMNMAFGSGQLAAKDSVLSEC